MLKQINKIIKQYKTNKISGKKTQQKLNEIEKTHPQKVFIKTNLCECGKLNIEVWLKMESEQ